MSTPPPGFIPDPKDQRFFFDPNGDPNADSSWYEQPPDGFEYDPANPGWALRPGDPQDALNWWHDWRVQDPPGLVKAIDVASYQPADLTGLIAATWSTHVIVRFYQQSVEGRALQEHTRAQVASALANGCTVSGYYWLYRDVPVEQQVREVLQLATQIGTRLPILYSDVEPYTDGSCPNGDQAKYALNYGRTLNQRTALYTGLYIWRERLGSIDLTGELLLSASYNGIPDLSTPTYGGLTVIGHQYNDHGPAGEHVDVDVLDGSVCQ